MKENKNVVLIKAHYINTNDNASNSPATASFTQNYIINNNLSKNKRINNTQNNSNSTSNNDSENKNINSNNHTASLTTATTNTNANSSFKAEIKQQLLKLNEKKKQQGNIEQLKVENLNTNHNNNNNNNSCKTSGEKSVNLSNNIAAPSEESISKTKNYEEENMILPHNNSNRKNNEKFYQNIAYDDSDVAVPVTKPAGIVVNTVNENVTDSSSKETNLSLDSTLNLIKTPTSSSFASSPTSNSYLKSNAKKYSNSIPHRVTLSWHSLSIKMQKKRSIDKILSNFCLGKRKSKQETILDNIKGIVEPGEMLALMGSR
jgi:hypothetical protein